MKRSLLGLLLLAAGLLSAQNNPVTPTSPLDDTQLGVFADRAYSKLAQPMAAAATQITLLDGSRFPDAEYWVTICPLNQGGVGASAANCETVFVTGKASTHVLTIGATGRDVQADQTGTATGDGGNPTHAIGEAVVLTPPAGWFNRVAAELKALRDEVGGGGGGGGAVQSGTYSALPGSGSAGDLYFFDGTDTPYDKAIHNGTSWDLYYGGIKCTPPDFSGWTWDNQGTSTLTTFGGAAQIAFAHSGGANRLLYKTAPATPYTITVVYLVQSHTNVWTGPGWRQASDGAQHMAIRNLNGLTSQKRNNTGGSGATSYSSLANSTTSTGTGLRATMTRIHDDGTDRIIDFPIESNAFVEMHSIGRTANLTPDQVMFWAMVSNSEGPGFAYVTVLSWKEE